MASEPVLHLDDPGPVAALLDLLGEQQDDLGRYAATWACRAEGFRPSPVCLLAPLGSALDPVRERVETLSAELSASWRHLADGVRGSREQLERAEDAVAHDLARLAHLAAGGGGR